MVLHHSSVGNPYAGMPFPQSYVLMLLAIATSNVFNNFFIA